MPDFKHPPSALRRRRGIVLLASWLTLAILSAIPGSAQDTTPTLDLAGSPTELLLDGGAESTFTFHLEAGNYLWVQVEQVGIDVAVAVLDSDGEVLDSIDFERDTRRFESIEVISRTTGQHAVRVRASRPDAPAGAVRIRVGEVRPQRPNDARLIAAERQYNEAAGSARRRTDEAMSRAASLYRQALVGFGAEKNLLGQAKTQTNLGLVLRRQGNLDAAIDAYQAALDGWRTLGDVRGETDTLLNLAVAHRRQRDFVRAEALGEEAVTRARAARPVAEARMLDSLAETFEAQAKPDRALALFNHALALREAAGDTRGAARSRAHLGSLYRHLGSYQQALDHLHLALNAFSAHSNERDRMAVLNSLGVAYDSLGQYDRAVVFFEQARTLSRNLHDHETESRIENNLGWARHFGGDPADAVTHFRAALAGLNGHDTANQARIRTNLGRSLLALGDADAARTELARARRYARSAGGDRLMAQVILELGHTEMALGHAEEAQAAWNGAFALAQEARDPRSEAAARFRLASLARAAGDFAGAQTHLEASLIALEGLRASVDGDRHRATFLASKRAHYSALVDLLMTRNANDPDGDWASQALVASERARARSLADVLGGAIAPGLGLDADVAWRRTERRLRALDHQRKTADPDARVAAEAAFEIALADAERERAHAVPASEKDGELRHDPVLDAADMQTLLDRDTGLLVVAPGTEQTNLWLATHDRLLTHVGPPSADVEAWARRAHRALTARAERLAGESLEARTARVAAADDTWHTVARALSNALLRPFADHLPSRLAIIADGALVYLPFAALPHPNEHDPSPLLVHHEIVRLPSASTLRLLREQEARRPPAQRLLAAIADPVFGDDDPRLATHAAETTARADTAGAESVQAIDERAVSAAATTSRTHYVRLPFAAREAKAIVDLLPSERTPDDVLLATGFDATRALVTSGDLASYRILHFATHGIIDSQFPERSALVLSLRDQHGMPRDGFVRLADLFALRLAADLVVLSACRTALGEAIAGEGHLGLTRGFLYAGASRVVSSLWAVQDKATRALMTRFYTAMFDARQTPADALRDAQLSMMNQPRYRAPYYWAGFELQGDWR